MWWSWKKSLSGVRDSIDPGITESTFIMSQVGVSTAHGKP